MKFTLLFVTIKILFLLIPKGIPLLLNIVHSLQVCIVKVFVNFWALVAANLFDRHPRVIIMSP